VNDKGGSEGDVPQKYKTTKELFSRAPVASGSLEWKFNVRAVIKSFIVGVFP
jgi:hypothetical protein